MTKIVKCEFQVEKDVFEALSLIRAVGDVLSQVDTSKMLEGSLMSLGNLLIDQAGKLGESLGVEL